VLIRLKHDKSAPLMVVVVSDDALQVSRVMLDTPAHEGDERGRQTLRKAISGTSIASTHLQTFQIAHDDARGAASDRAALGLRDRHPNLVQGSSMAAFLNEKGILALAGFRQRRTLRDDH